MELTSVVGNFLCWDETGGHAIIRKNGNKGLVKILDSENTFHANLLKKDIVKLLGKGILPNYSEATSKYLLNLLRGLESANHIKRCAYMVSFENHAGIMIDALWQSLTNLFKIEKDDLIYFKTHVGGADPAEPYHIEMTEKMVAEIVSLKTDDFADKFLEGYRLHYDWCQSIKEN